MINFYYNSSIVPHELSLEYFPVKLPVEREQIRLHHVHVLILQSIPDYDVVNDVNRLTNVPFLHEAHYVIHVLN